MTLDKLKYGAINNKKIILFLLGLSIVGVICGSLFMTIISKTDQTMVKNYMMEYMVNLNHINFKNVLFNSLITNLFFIISIWLLGISVIGVPIIVFMYFSKIFTLGFSISSFILTYKFKGLLISLIYIFPIQILNIGLYTLITLYAIKISSNLIYSIFNKKEVNFKSIINKYIKILMICIIACLISVLYENTVLPFLLNKLILLLKI